jgi:hypothetical protein
LPEDVSALVSRITADEAELTLVNVNQLEARHLVIRSGAYGEHEIVTLTLAGRTTTISRSDVRIRLAPGAGGKLILQFKRHVHPPTFAPPWAS